ncbi:MAG: hypothetical protein IKP86_11805, partial [Anaerolineaceae bacterium]|nr:hypothetical protein [Anaerolineaceae bacterium]
MRKYFLILILMICLILTGNTPTRAESSSTRIILYTYYRQMGWGDRVQIGWVDDSGAVRTLDGHDSALKWPYKPEEQLEYLSEKSELPAASVLKHNDLFSIKSLIYSVEDQGSKSVPAANDAGTEKSFAVRYSKEGDPELILLGMSGDDLFENTDPNAQALYRILRVLFSGVTSYAYDSLGMGPQGFIPVPFSEFTGLDEDILSKAEIKGFLSDCEEG